MTLKRKINLYAFFTFFQRFNFYLPIKIVYFSHFLNNYALAASIISISFISSAFFEIPTGVFSDMIGRRKTIILGVLATIASYLLYAVGSDYWIFILGAVFDGAGKAFFSGNNDAYLHNVLSEGDLQGEYHHYYSKVGSVASLGSSTASLLSGFILYFSFPLLMWLNIIPQIISLLLCFMMPEVKSEYLATKKVFFHLKEAVLMIKNNLNLRLLFLADISGSGPGQSAYEFHIAVINLVWPSWAIGIARAMQEWLVIPGFYFAGKIINKFGKANIVFYSSLVSWLSNILAGIFPSFLSPLFIASGTILYGPSDTANESLLQKEFTNAQRATISSLSSLLMSIYFGIIAYITGLFANAYGPFNALLLTQVIYIPSLVFTWLYLKRVKKDLQN